MRHAASHAMRALRNAFFSSGRRLFGLSFSLDYLRFAWRSRRMDNVGPGSLTVAGMRVGYDNQSHALFLLHEIFVNAEYDFVARVACPRIVDCGANNGMAVLFFKARYPNADVLAFEPHPSALNCLKQNIDFNRLESVVAERAAVTEHARAAPLFCSPHRSVQPHRQPRSLVGRRGERTGEGGPARRCDYL